MATDTLPLPARNAPLAPAQRGFTGLVDIVQHLGELWDLGKILVESRMLPQSIQSPNAAVAIMLKGHELGIGPMHAFDGISVIQGKPTISPQLMQALVERSGLLEDIRVEEADRPMACRITLTRKGRSPQSVAFTQDEAHQMGLWGKGNWAKMPAVMLYWRCVAKAYRRVFPDVIAGCYTPEEMGAEVDEDGEIVAAEVVDAEPPGQGKVMGVYSRTNPHPRDTGYGVGEFLHPDRNAEYEKWAKSFIAKANEKWQDHWGRRLESGQGLPDGIPHDLINWFRLTNHLMKWLRESRWIDPAQVRDDLKNDHGPKYLALVYHQSPEARAALRTEIKDYLGKVFNLTCDSIYRKHPDLAPDGWAEEQEEARRRAEEEAGEQALDEMLDARGQDATGIGSSPGDDKDGDWGPGRE